jgi:hypothetical protein
MCSRLDSPQPLSLSSSLHSRVENSDCDEEDKLEVVKKWSSSAVLGFNEPDVGDKSLSVEEALRLWEKLQPLSGRLGSPATAANPTDEGSWLQQFMEGCKERGLRVDFIALHWYGWDPSLWEDTHAQLEEFKRAVQGVHDKFQLPLWVTEYSLIGWGSDPPTYPTPEVEARFAAASAEWMNSVPFVEKFAWFALPNGLWEDSKREPTGVGRAYRDAR